MTPFEKKGWKATDKFRVIDESPYFSKGEIVTLAKDGGEDSALFINDAGVTWYKTLDHVERIEETHPKGAVAKFTSKKVTATQFYAFDVKGTDHGFDVKLEDGSPAHVYHKYWGIEYLNEGNEKPDEWNGDGMPPVGTVCEFKFKGHPDSQWKNSKILWSSQYQFLSDEGRAVKRLIAFSDVDIRPTRTEREKEIDAAVSVLQEYMPSGGRDYDQAIGIYEAIAAGKIPGLGVIEGKK